jgi:hypothetical protein
MIGSLGFTHTHIVDGKVITHSHPYKGTSNNPSHSHSSAQLLTIAQLTHWLVSAAFIALLIQIISGKTFIRNISGNLYIRNGCNYYCFLRAPPSFRCKKGIREVNI